MAAHAQPLGRIAPTDWTHVERYPLTASVMPPKPVPVAIGVNWYVEFDTPERDSAGHYWIARSGKLTTIRGGHCVCLKPRGVKDQVAWWRFYDQGREGACVGFGCSRMMTLLNRKRYDARWLWNAAKSVDEWPDTNPGDDNGTSVSAGCDVLRTQGLQRYGRTMPTLDEGIAANRWALSTPDTLAALGMNGSDYVEILNSWGVKGYPHVVRMPVEVLDRLRLEDGEIAIVTDR